MAKSVKGNSAEATAASRMADAANEFLFIFDIPGIPLSIEIQFLHLIKIERSRALTAKHRDLTATLINAAITIEAFR